MAKGKGVMLGLASTRNPIGGTGGAVTLSVLLVAGQFESLSRHKVLSPIANRQPHLTLDDQCSQGKGVRVRRDDRVGRPDTFENFIEALGGGPASEL
jgi:hypothetical protein